MIRRAAALLLLGSSCLASAAQGQSFSRNLAERALERGAAQEARGDIAQALTSYDEAVRADSTLGLAALRLGSLRERMGDRDEAELLYGHAITAPETAADAYFARAMLRNAQQRRREALADLSESVALSAKPERIKVLAGWYVEARLWSAALTAFRALLEDARAGGTTLDRRDAELTVAALSWLASDSDPVLSGATSTSWVRRSLAKLARSAAKAGAPAASRSTQQPQGARKLTP